MRNRFESSLLKVARAEKHIFDIYAMFRNFSETDFYSLRVEENPEKTAQFLRVDMNLSGLYFEQAALIIGDAIHNLRSALDHLWYQVVLICDGHPDRHTKFPFADSREDLGGLLKSSLKNRQINANVTDFVRDVIKPYQAGNPTLWGLHKLNIIDKHEMIVPVLKLVGFFDIRLEDENGERIGRADYIADESCSIKLSGSYGKKIHLKDKGRASSNVIFDIGASIFAGETVFPVLKRISGEVSRTLEAFSVFEA